MFSRVETAMQKSAAFQSLSASALRVLLWAINKNYKAVSKAGAPGKPTFKLTNAEAKNDYGLSSTTFTNAKNQLEEKGFLEWVQRGGLKGCKAFAQYSAFLENGKIGLPPPKNKIKILNWQGPY